MTRLSLVIALAIIILSGSFVLAANVPRYISYQGRLTDDSGNPVTDGTYNISFEIYGSFTGGTLLHAHGPFPIPVTDGLFDHQIWVPTGVLKSDYNYLAITVNGVEQSPRTYLVSVPFALYAESGGGWAYDHIIDATLTEATTTKVGINNDDPQEPLSIGANLGSKYGDFLQIGNNDGQYSGFMCGKDIENHGYMLWDNSSNELRLGGEFDDDPYSAIIRMKNGNVGINIEPSNIMTLRVDKGYNTSSTCYGIANHAKNSSSGDVFGIWSKAEHLNWTPLDRHIRGVYGIGIVNGASIAEGPTTIGVQGYASGGNSAIGIYGGAANAYDNRAGYFDGQVDIHGGLYVYGHVVKSSGSFRIDHPLEPENKYLQHSFVESPDMMNIYNGNVILDNNGKAVVEMPDWFEPLNKEFRYQLTSIGSPGPNLYIAEEVSGNHFAIAGGEPGMKVSWQVTGIRQDEWAEENRIEVEVEKEGSERGRYLHPEVFGQGEEKGIGYEIRRDANELPQTDQ